MHEPWPAVLSPPPTGGTPSGRLLLVVHSMCMLLVGLEIPAVSSAIMLLAGLISLQHFLRARIASGAFLWRMALLASALAAYYLLSVGNGFIEPSRAFWFALTMASGFAAGHSGSRCADDHRSHEALWGLLSAVAGSTVFACLSTYRGWTPTAEVMARDAVKVPTLWTGEPVTATVLGAQLSLGVCMLPAALFWGGDGSARRGGVLRVALALLAAAGIYANVVLQNRNPFVSGAAAVAFGGLLLARSRGVSTSRKVALGLPLVLAGALVALVPTGIISQLGAFQRFRSEGLETARYEVWGQVFSHLLDNLTGGRVTWISAEAAHNLWLDIGWDAGPVPFALMAAFHLSIAIAAVAVIRRAPLRVSLVLAGAGIAFLLTSMAEPAMSLSIGYTSLLFYYCGVITGLLSSPVLVGADAFTGAGDPRLRAPSRP